MRGRLWDLWHGHIRVNNTHSLRTSLLPTLHLTNFCRLKSYISPTYSKISWKHLVLYDFVFWSVSPSKPSAVSSVFTCHNRSNSLNTEKRSLHLVFTTAKPSDATEEEVEDLGAFPHCLHAVLHKELTYSSLCLTMLIFLFFPPHQFTSNCVLWDSTLLLPSSWSFSLSNCVRISIKLAIS